MSGIRRSRSTFVVLVLCATLGMTAALGYEAWQSARSHRASAENVLRDYSTFAAWELTRLGRQQLLDAMNHGIEAVRAARRRGDLAGALREARRCPSGCGGSPRIVSAFVINVDDLRFSSAGAALPLAVRSAVEKAIASGLRDPENFTCPALAVVSDAGSVATVVWTPVLDTGRPSEVIGFVSDASLVSKAFESVITNQPLLPPSLVRASADRNAALAVRVSTRTHQQLFASSTEWSAYQATATLPAAFDNLTLAVALRPASADELVIGGLPRERLPLVIGLLALTTGLVVVALVQLRREAEISRMRADFVAGVSHELRTPLAQIRMFSETLLLGRVRNSDESRRSLEIIGRESQRLAQLVENALLFSRGERRRPELAREDARLAPIVQDVVDGFAPLAAARQANIVTELDQTTAARVDAGAIRQVLLNLLDNAVKYGPTGQTVRVALTFQRNTARLEVDDEGPGVGPADGDRIWRPFNRLAGARAATGGAGIGLAIVRQLVELHGGRAWVERGPAGARFVVEIPGAWVESAAGAA